MKFPIEENLSPLAMNVIHVIAAADTVVKTAGKAADKVRNRLQSKKEEKDRMKKSTMIAIIVALAAVVGALAAMCAYLRRREAELDEYEQLLFSEDFSHEQSGDEPSEEAEPAEETAAPGSEEEA